MNSEDAVLTKLQGVIDRVKYKPGAYIGAAYSRPQTKDFIMIRMAIQVPDVNEPGKLIRVFEGHDLPTATIHRWSEEEILLYLRDVFVSLEKHEVDEWFTVDGVKKYDPHKND